jgi:5,10-methylenetetrahydromethanopterin reductase
MGDRLGVRWGYAGGTTLATVAETRDEALWAEQAGFDSFWVSQAAAVDPVVALAAIAGDTALGEVGTSVVPLYGRHPLSLAQAARTAQSALGGRLTLGVGPSHRVPVETSMGLSWDHAFGYTRDFLAGLLPLLAGEPADVEGERVTTRAALRIDAPDTPVLLAALGPRMLDLAGRVAAGTTLGQTGPKSIASHVVPALHAAAEAAGRARPRIMALVGVCVTDDLEAAGRAAYAVGEGYNSMPSYREMVRREGKEHPSDLYLRGSWEQVLEGIAAYATAGVTDLRLVIIPGGDDDLIVTKEALAAHLAGG